MTYLRSIWLYFILIFYPAIINANSIHIAVASNFAKTAEKLIFLFEKETGYKAKLSKGSTGKLYAQIKHGAPFDIFMAADQLHPILLEKEKKARPLTRFTYAIGKLVLWSPEIQFTEQTVAGLLADDRVQHIAIANPKLAPYGKAAEQTLQALSLLDKSKSKLVIGENISQTFQFVASGNAQAGFIAASQIQMQNKGSYWAVPQPMFTPIQQDVIILSSTDQHEIAQTFIKFLKSKSAKQVIVNSGYTTITN